MGRFNQNHLQNRKEMKYDIVHYRGILCIRMNNKLYIKETYKKHTWAEINYKILHKPYPVTWDDISGVIRIVCKIVPIHTPKTLIN